MKGNRWIYSNPLDWRKALEQVIPLLCAEPFGRALEFYQCLGFTATYEQHEPYNYSVIERGNIALHLSDFKGQLKPQKSVCLVMVTGLKGYYDTFAESLRTHYGRVPTAGYPRITRWRESVGRFGLFDLSGNWLVFIEATPQTDAETTWEEADWGMTSSLLTALSLAELYRDFKGNDDIVAAKILDTALKRTTPDDSPSDLAQVLLARAELAIALGEAELLGEFLARIENLSLTPAEHAEVVQARQELTILQEWIHRSP